MDQEVVLTDVGLCSQFHFMGQHPSGLDEQSPQATEAFYHSTESPRVANLSLIATFHRSRKDPPQAYLLRTGRRAFQWTCEEVAA